MEFDENKCQNSDAKTVTCHLNIMPDLMYFRRLGNVFIVDILYKSGMQCVIYGFTDLLNKLVTSE